MSATRHQPPPIRRYQSSLRDVLDKQAWREDWPSDLSSRQSSAHGFSHTAAPPDWVASWFPEIREILTGQIPSRPVPQSVVRSVVADLASFNEEASRDMTWPPTIAGFAAALAHSDSRAAAVVCALYPSLAALAWASRIEPDVKPVPQLSSSPVASHEDAVKPSVTTPASGMRQDKSVMDWTRQLIQSRVPVTSEESALAASRFESTIVAMCASAGMSQEIWFRDKVMPTLASLTADDMDHLLIRWPHSAKIAIADINQVFNGRFWAAAREAVAPGPLMEKVLPAILNVDMAAPGALPAFLLVCIGKVTRDANLLDRRMAFWKSLGGRPDIRVEGWPASILETASETSANEAFSAVPPKNSMNALEWMSQADVTLWADYAIRHSPARDASRHRYSSP